MAWSIALKAPNGRRVQHMASHAPGDWSLGAAEDIDGWAHATLLAKDWDGWIMYNDEPPTGNVGGTCGHCKGVVAWNSREAGWLIHSVPLWPPAFRETIDKKELLENIKDDQVEFGQSFAWLEFPRADLQKVLRHLALMQPAVYACNDEAGEWRAMKKAPADEEDRIAWLDLGEGLEHVAKCRQWGKCLFKDGLVGKYGGPCVAETWCRPKPVPTPDVSNAVVLAWPSSDPQVAYHESQDHSKYAFSSSEESAWAYVGDINNMKSQWKRGGGGLVFRDPSVRNALAGLVHQTDQR